MKIRKFLSFFSFILITSIGETTVSAEARNLKVEKNIGFINDVHTDNSRLLIGAESGLWEVIGKTINQLDSLVNGEEVVSISTSSGGKIWAATSEGKVFAIDFDKQGKQVSSFIDLGKGYACIRVENFSVYTLIALCNKNIYLLNKANLEILDILTSHRINSVGDIRTFHVSADELIYFATFEREVYQLDINTSELKKVLETKSLVDSLGSMEGGVLLVLSNNELIRIDKDSSVFSKKLDANENGRFFSEFSVGPKGSIYVWGNEIVRINMETDELVVDSVLAVQNFISGVTNVNDIELGMDGELIVVDSSKGILTDKLTKDAISLLLDSNSEVQNHLFYSLKINNESFLYSSPEGIYLQHENDATSQKLVDQTYLVDAALLTDQQLYLAEYQKDIVEINMKTRKSVRLSNDSIGLPNASQASINGFLKKSNDEVFVAISGRLESGIYLGSFSAGFNAIYPGVDVYDLVASKKNGFYFGTESKGVLQYTPKGVWETWPYTAEGSVIANCMVEDQHGVIWVCTDGDGLGYLDPASKTVKFLDPKHTANSKYIRELVEDTQGFLWVMTNNGLVRFEPDSKESILLGSEEGIDDSDFEITASINLSDDKILVAGDTKNYIIDTRKMNAFLTQRMSKEFTAIITDLLVTPRDEQQSLSSRERLNLIEKSGSPLEFTYDELIFTLKFAVNSYIYRDILGFEYRLLGLSDEWRQLSPDESHVTYNTLPHGNYEFQLRVHDPKSTVAQPITSVKIRVLPPFWLTWQAYLVYLTLLIFSIWLGYKLRVKHLERTNLQLQSQVMSKIYQIGEIIVG